MKRLLAIALLIASTSALHAQVLAVKTNALMDAAMVPNIGFELVTGNRTSINANAFVGYRIYGQNLNIQAINPEFRYYPMGKVMHKFFIGVSTMFTHYDMSFSKERFMGDAGGGGITFGWVIPLSEYHWNLEIEAAVGAFYYTHRRSWLVDPERPNREYNEHGLMFMPYKLGVNFSYIMRYKKEVDSKNTKKKRRQLEMIEKERADSLRFEMSRQQLADSLQAISAAKESIVEPNTEN